MNLLFLKYTFFYFSEELTIKSLNLSIEQVVKFGDSFREAIIEFKNKYFEDRKQVLLCRYFFVVDYLLISIFTAQVLYFTQYMIVIVNNCLQLVDLGSQLEKQYLISSSPHKLSDNFNNLRGAFFVSFFVSTTFNSFHAQLKYVLGVTK